LLSGLLLSGSLFAQQKHETSKTEQNMLSSTDRSFITSAEQGNLAEVDTAKMVQQRTTDPAVKDFASRMVTDHTRASQQLKALASSEGITLPAEPIATERTQNEQWKKLSGAKLNDTYLRDQLEDHQQAISVFENEIEHGKDQAVKNYAEQTLPVLQDHIRIAEDLAGKMDMSGKAGLSDRSKAITAK